MTNTNGQPVPSQPTMTNTGEQSRRRLASRMRLQGGCRPVRHALVAACLLSVSASASFAQVKADFLYTLSSFSGRLPYDGVRVSVDRQRGEIYVIYQNLVRIFSPSGMETFTFGDGLELGQVLDAAVDDNGDVNLLSFKDAHSIVTRCNFRGVPVGRLEMKNLPAGVAFDANRMLYRNGLYYFASLTAASVIVTDSTGEFRRRVDLASLMEEDDKKQGDAETIGFTVDRDGNIFFTVPALFRVFKVSPDGKLTSFGKPGSAPGRFGVVAGLASDSRGNLLVADKLKCVVMVFDKDFNFLTEFGSRGSRPGNLIVPDDVAVDGKDRVYVSQWRRRGVSVFALVYN